VYANATWDDVSVTYLGVPAAGTLTDATGSPPGDGVYVRQSAASGASICFVLDDAGTLTSILTTDGKFDATYCLEGEQATTWSLGTPAPPPPGTASALRVDPANTNVAAGATLKYRSSHPATLVMGGFGVITCASTTSDITAGVSGGTTVTGTLDALTFTSCTDTVPVVNITSCVKVASTFPTVAFRATGASGGTETLTDVFVKCFLAGSSSGCYYKAATAVGNVQNIPSLTTFSGVSTTHTVPAGATDDFGALCGAGGSFSVTFTDFTLGTTGTTVTLRTL
jgi:hypothetical protein